MTISELGVVVGRERVLDLRFGSEDWMRRVDDAANVDNGLTGSRIVGAFKDGDCESGSIGVRDWRFDDWIKMAEVSGQYSLVEKRESPSSNTSGCRRGQHLVCGGGDVGCGPGEIDCDRVFERNSVRENDSFKIGHPSITEVENMTSDRLTI